MSMTLAGKSIAILAANGFDEKHMTEIQRAFTRAKLSYKVVAPEQGLVNGWQDSAWGHYFPVDMPIGTAMGSDFDLLVLVGGERGIAKLKSNPHTRRIVNHFLEAGKPIAAIGAGVALLALSPKAAGREVAALSEIQDELKAAAMQVSEESQICDANLLSATGADVAAWAEAALTMAMEIEDAEETEHSVAA